jgi:hypothetical protein
MTLMIRSQFGCEGDKTVWHYTNGNGFLGILQTKSIWASSVVFLNDSAEIFEAFKIAREVAHNDQRGGAELACLEVALSRAGDARGGVDALNHLGVFVSSFSSKCDDLSQWRSYASGAGGSYCLGFAPSLLKKMGSGLDFSLEKVEYEKSAQKALVKPIVDRLLASLGNLDIAANTILAQQGAWPLRDVPAELTESIETFAKEIKSVAPRIKNSAFSGEEEWRMILASTESSQTIDFRTTDTGLVPYLPISFPENEFSLRGVVVGPSPRLDKNFAAAVSALNKFSANCPGCSTSGIPFRNW